jgi:hypothetical protein
MALFAAWRADIDNVPAPAMIVVEATLLLTSTNPSLALDEHRCGARSCGPALSEGEAHAAFDTKLALSELQLSLGACEAGGCGAGCCPPATDASPSAIMLPMAWHLDSGLS